MAAASSSVFNNFKLSTDKRTLTFTLGSSTSPCRVTYANTLRRAIQTEVPVLCFNADMEENGKTSDVIIFKNTTPMSNEMLADRIGLLPIFFRPSQEWIKENYRFVLHVVNEDDSSRYITASDFKVYKKSEIQGEGEIEIPSDKFFIPDPVSKATCLIAILKGKVQGQAPEEIYLEARADFGIGRQHARYNPTCQASYGYTLDNDATRRKAMFEDWLRNQKKVDPKILEENPGRLLSLRNEFASLEINRCYLMDDEGEPYSYDFTVESIGIMNPIAILDKALEAIIIKCLMYSLIDGGDVPETVEIRPADARLKGYDIWFQNEDHTLGNLLQTWLDDNKVLQGPQNEMNGEITFAGYKVPHPLRNEMVLRIGVNDDKKESAILALGDAARGCAQIFTEWSKQLLAAAAAQGLYTKEEAEQRVEGIKTTWEAHVAGKQKGKEAAQEAPRRSKAASKK